jgi:plastocyanin
MLATFGLALALVGAACNSNNSPAASAGGPAASTGGGGAANAVSIVDFAFNPTSASVKAGTSVTWTNTGSTAHTVTADDGSFDSGNVSGGATFTQAFATAGTFTYHCKIHSSMKATIVVTP